MSAPMCFAVGCVLFDDRHARSCRLVQVQRRAVTAKYFQRRPFRQHGNGWWSVPTEFISCMYNFAVHDGQHRLDAFDLLASNHEIIISECYHVGQLTVGDSPFFATVIGKPAAALRVQAQCLIAAEAIALRVHRYTTNGLARPQPVKRDPWVIARDTCGIGAGTHRDAQLKHLAHGWGTFDGLLPVPIHEVFTLIRHAVLYGDTAAQGFDTFQVSIANSLTMIEEPIQSREWQLSIDVFKHSEESGDTLVISGVQTKWPFVCRQQTDDVLQITLQRRAQLGTRLQEVFKVRCAKNQHFTRAIAAIEVIAMARRSDLDPAREVLPLLLGMLRKKVIGDANCHVATLMQFVNDRVVFRVVLEAAAGINGAGDPKAIELAHEVTR